MTHRNVVRFATVPPREIVLVSVGTMWPQEIIVDGEAWLMGDVVDVGRGYCTRVYTLSEHLTPSQRLLHALQGGA